MKSVRLPMFTEKDHTLIGYWFLRTPDEDSDKFILTYKLGKDDHHRLLFADPAKAVVAFYASAVNYWESQLHQLDKEVQALPTREFKRNGFRPGWLAKTRRALEDAKTKLRDAYKENLFRQLQKLKDSGWPTPGLPDLSWMTLNAVRAAATLWIRTGGNSPPVSSESVGQKNSPDSKPSYFKRGEDLGTAFGAYSAHSLGGGLLSRASEAVRSERDPRPTLSGGDLHKFSERFRALTRVDKAAGQENGSSHGSGSSDKEAGRGGSPASGETARTGGSPHEAYLRVQKALGLGSLCHGDSGCSGNPEAVRERVPGSVPEATPELVPETPCQHEAVADGRPEGAAEVPVEPQLLPVGHREPPGDQLEKSLEYNPPP